MSAIKEMIELVRYNQTVSPTIRDAAIKEHESLMADRADLQAAQQRADEWERKALEQSEDVQQHWLSPVEAEGLKHRLAALEEDNAAFRKLLVKQAKYFRDMKRIFYSDDRSDEKYAIQNLASYNYFKGAYETIRAVWWSIAHLEDVIL